MNDNTEQTVLTRIEGSKDKDVFKRNGRGEFKRENGWYVLVLSSQHYRPIFGNMANELEDAYQRLLLVEGVDGTFDLNGRRFITKKFGSVAAANAFMENNNGWGVIGEIGNENVYSQRQPFEVHVAKNDDKGEKISLLDAVRKGLKHVNVSDEMNVMRK